MKKGIIIGATPRFITEDGILKYFINETYVQAMNSIGFNTIVLTLDNPNFEAVLDLCDGFLVTGGIDVHPKWFNEEMNGTGEVNERLDMIDKQVIDYAVKNKKPLLGICRGHQVINVFMGGSLIQDIGTSHRSTRHDIISFENDLLKFKKQFNANSYHHQVVKDLAPGLIEVARSHDNYNEAYVSYEYPIVSVQWHPEKTPNEDSSKLIFECFKNLVLNNK